jgi:hypothetical protein
MVHRLGAENNRETNMAKQSWHNQPKNIETDMGMARSGAAKKLTPLRTHPSMSDRTSTSLGAPPTGALPDASSPMPTDDEKQHMRKVLPVPACHPSMKSDSERGSYKPEDADRIMGEAARPAADFAPDLHTLPASTTED